ncbi:D-alanine--D-alanine ligase [Salmonella enterica subsp. enterica serovar Newport]|uniref:D-alanine--D-alanine ligase n=2 Tax=Salmonella enterica TaxID=28901 RepID=A0A7D8IWM2_SALER|nr:D-alanine--D-alanine ligase [Salmonella enterica]EBU7355895.1 D-alanine--D-alanine ligase [Salmonella enterica subsp. enterica serovar Poona]ECA0401965.1 D-alanine--D-alanine ligase [Salmonella enterica subsp. enterica serovar Newport]EDJ8883433.1 D-alanine--D-alanine ligase [Salmonella enterica subsp. diarizonae]EDL1202908.1 D-alanine--D-alanine ligase [Salmonella enterica subsp. enterica serovar Typhimurium]EDR2896924.1 D-alanine--D-alanine ligase [Salmonella enterica subsp. enterica sero
MKKVLVLCGGFSKERDISMVTGRACAAALKDAGYDTYTIDVDRTLPEKLRQINPDVCFNALHGPYGEDGSVQGLLNIMGIPYTHSGVGASSIAMDKIKTKAIACQHGIHVVEDQLIDYATYKSMEMPFPYVLKPVNDGSSIATYIFRTPDAEKLSEQAWTYNTHAMMERYIKGRELTVTVFMNKPVTVTEIIPSTDHQFYNFQAKYDTGGSLHSLPADIPDKAFNTCMENALTMHELLGCRGISRSDFILDENTGNIFFLEINTQPGMTPTSLVPEQLAWAGISFTQLVSLLVDEATIDVL